MPYMPTATLLSSPPTSYQVTNVLDFATGDGVTNDTAAISNARNAAGVNGILYFPAGVYSVTRLDANVAGQTWVLDRGCTVKLRAGTNDMVIKVSANKVTIRGPGTIDGTKASNPTANYGIQLYHCDDSVVDGVTLINTTAYGLMAYGGNNRCKFINNTVTGTDTVGIYVTAVDGHCYDTWIMGNYVDRSAIGSGIAEGCIQVHAETAFGTFNCYRTKVHDNLCVMPISPVSASGVCIEVFRNAPQCSIEGNHVINGSIGVSVDRADSSAIVGNVCLGQSLYGIELAASNNCSITGNTVDGDGITDKGIAIQNTSPDANAVTGNTIRNLKSTGTGIEVNNGEFNTISGNAIDSTTSLYGITVNASPRASVNGNTIRSSLGIGIRLIASSDWSVVIGNIFYGSDASAIQLGDTSDNLVISGNVVEDDVASFISMASGSAGSNVKAYNNIGNGTGNNQAQYDYHDWQGKIISATGSGSPESSLAAGVGSWYLDLTNGEAYIKKTGTGNTGWKAITHA